MANYEYSHEYSDFPNSLIKLHKYKNVDDSVASVFNQLNSLRSQGYYKQAQKIIKENDLSQYCPDAVTINTLFEEIQNAQIYSQNISQPVQFVRFDESEPNNVNIEDVWIGA